MVQIHSTRLQKTLSWCPSKFGPSVLAVVAMTILVWYWKRSGSAPFDGIQRYELPLGGYSLDISSDGNILAVSTKEYHPEQSSVTQLSADLQPRGIAAEIPQKATHIEFVSNKFGFLIGSGIDHGSFEEESWPVSTTLQRCGLDGSCNAVSAPVAYRISSLSTSADGTLAVLCRGVSRGGPLSDKCAVYSLLSGELITTSSLKDTASRTPLYGLQATFVDAKRCLIVASPYGTKYSNRTSAILMDAETGNTICELPLYDNPRQIHSIVQSSTTNEVFVAIAGRVGRITIFEDRLEFEDDFYTSTAIGPGSYIQWLDYNAKNRALAIGESIFGSSREAVTQIIDVKTRKALKLAKPIPIAGPMRFSPDGESLYILVDSLNYIGMQTPTIKSEGCLFRWPVLPH